VIAARTFCATFLSTSLQNERSDSMHIRAVRNEQLASEWLVPIIAGTMLAAFIFGAAVLLLSN